MFDVRDIARDVKEYFVDPISRPTTRNETSKDESTENSPLLKDQHASNTLAVQNDRTGMFEPSYDVLMYQDLDNGITYGSRREMIANACKLINYVEGGEVSDQSRSPSPHTVIGNDGKPPSSYLSLPSNSEKDLSLPNVNIKPSPPTGSTGNSTPKV